MNKYEKALPKKATIVHYLVNIFDADLGIEKLTQCPVCGYELRCERLTRSTGKREVLFDEKPSICPDCGQALDWSDEDE